MRTTLLLCLLICPHLPGVAADSSSDAAFAASIRAERSGDYAAARSALAPFEQRLAGDYLYQVRMAWLALCAGDHRQALLGYRAAHNLEPDSFEPPLGQARAHLLAQRWVDAETVAR